jgi:hypothetical protein
MDPTVLKNNVPTPGLVATMSGALAAVCPKCGQQVELTKVTSVPDDAPRLGAPGEQTDVDYSAYYSHLATHKG